VNVRFLGEPDARGLQERYRGALARTDAEALSASAEARILVLPGPLGDGLRALLNEAGIVVAFVDGTTLLAASRAALERVRARSGGDDRGTIEACLHAFERAATLPERLRLRERMLELRDEAHVMGIVNVTPDSFYERVADPGAAVLKARQMVDAGAALIDIGGQSYAHWNAQIDADEERSRVVPAVRAIVAAGVDVALSIDTFKASVADAALAAGAHAINDCSGLSDPALAGVVAKHGAGLVVMHLRGRLNVREPAAYEYRDAVAEIVDELYAKTERALVEGVARDAIAIDPGLEFGKEPETDLEILERFGELRALGYPILFASSRKSFIGRIFDRPAKELLVPSLATAAIGIAAGARIVRVHDVAETVQLARMLAAVAPERRRSLAIAARMPGTPEPSGNSRSSGMV
jgi:dihydropteroate synthase